MALFLKTLNGFSRKTFYRKCHSPNPWKGQSIDFNVPLRRQPLKFNFGKLARFADGSCVALLGDTEVMVTAVSKSKGTVSSFVPLIVDYRQKSAAAGRIPTNHLRKELAPTEKETLTSRLIDRSVRPLFPKGFGHETQLSCELFAVDGENDPDVVSINAASAALAISDIPWNGPIGAVRVGFINGEVIINPTRKEITKSALNLVVAATEHNQVVMLDVSADNIIHDDFMRALKAGVEETQVIIASIKEVQKKIGKSKKELDHSMEPSEEMIDSAKLLLEAKVTEVLTDFDLHKVSRGQTLDVVKQAAFEKLKENYTDCEPSILYEAINTVTKQTFRNLILETGKRCDGRGLKEVRDVSCSVNNNKILHGSSLFQRGQTQVRCTVAFDSPDSAFQADAVSVLTGGLKEKNFMLNYEFPAYATNEIGRMGSYGRREMGHGALAERSLRPVMPTDFEFTTQLTAIVLESNGSSSMATVCGGSLALMDAGVPISDPVAGVAMGLISVPHPEKPHEIADYRIITDILGLEDYQGDMDFKIAGSRNGITSAQLDIKIPGLPLTVIAETLQQAADAKNHILSIMNKTISKPREARKDRWPVSEKLEVPVHKLSQFKGMGGINFKKLRAEIGVLFTPLDAEKGVFSVFAPNPEAMAEANEMIANILNKEKEPELNTGAIYTAKIVELRDYGVMVTLYPTMKPTLLPNTQLDQRKVHHPSALGLEVGQEIKVKYFGRDPESGSMRLSRKILKESLDIVKNHFIHNQSKVEKTNSQIKS